VISSQTEHGISEGGEQSFSEHSSASLQHHFLEAAELPAGLASRKKHKEQEVYLPIDNHWLQKSW